MAKQYRYVDKEILKFVYKDKDVSPKNEIQTNPHRIILNNGVNIDCYDNGTIYCNGKGGVDIQTQVDKLEEILAQQKKSVFIVYNTQRSEVLEIIEKLLEGWNIKPNVMDKNPNWSRTLFDKVQSDIKNSDQGIVIMTADDRLEDGTYVSRSNILIEYGILLGIESIKNIILLREKQDDFPVPTDILGVAYYPFEEKTLVQDISQKLLEELYPNGII